MFMTAVTVSLRSGLGSWLLGLACGHVVRTGFVLGLSAPLEWRCGRCACSVRRHVKAT
jgi:hypothetical protein